MFKCKKKSFPDSVSADLRVAFIKKHGDERLYQPMRSYQCDICKQYHLTSKTKEQFHKNTTLKRRVINTKKELLYKRRVDKQGKKDLKLKGYLKEKRKFKNK